MRERSPDLACADGKRPKLDEEGSLMGVASAVKSICPRANPESGSALEDACVKAGLDTPLLQAHFLAQCAHESGGFSVMEENLAYSAQGLANTWPRIYAADRNAKPKVPNPLAVSLVGNKQGIANNSYAGRNGNRDVASGDGWSFRGRGFIQLTGRENYRKASNEMLGNDDLIAKPDLAMQPKFAALSAVWYWNNRRISEPASQDDLNEVTLRV